MADGEFFTRATWRAGKKFRLRKRTKPWGGCKTAPPAFLEAAKHAGFKPGRPGYRICSATKRDGSPCGRLALKGLKVCEAHGGFSVLARQGKLLSSGRTAAFKAARAVEGRYVGADSLAHISASEPVDQNKVGESLGHACVDGAGAANTAVKIFSFAFEGRCCRSI